MMVEPIEDFAPNQTLSLQVAEQLDNLVTSPSVQLSEAPAKLSKPAIRASLRASTLDGVFASIFGSVSGGVLFTDFLLKLGATNAEIGLLSAVPMVANFLQPVGAYLSDRTNSRRRYNLFIFGSSRLLWLVLALGIIWTSWHPTESQQLMQWTVGIVLVANLLGAIGCASWLSWMAALVPQQLRGRYFGFRNSASGLTGLVSVPLMGLGMSVWGGGTLQGYGVFLGLGVVAGFASLLCQCFMTDINPQAIASPAEAHLEPQQGNFAAFLQDGNFLRFLLYFGLWTFACQLSAPFFNIYLLKDLELNVGWVTVYTSLGTVANLLMLMVWGHLADRVGNRTLLLLMGILAAVMPLLWVGTGNNAFCVWLWIPLLHLVTGGIWAAIDLCSNNIQMEIAPQRQPSTYFATAAAVAGVCGALGTTTGGFLAQLPYLGGLGGLFALSALLRLGALLPLVFVREPRTLVAGSLLRIILPWKQRSVSVPVVELGDRG